MKGFDASAEQIRTGKTGWGKLYDSRLRDYALTSLRVGLRSKQSSAPKEQRTYVLMLAAS